MMDKTLEIKSKDTINNQQEWHHGSQTKNNS